jgi:hypothetical protein
MLPAISVQDGLFVLGEPRLGFLERRHIALFESGATRSIPFSTTDGLIKMENSHKQWTRRQSSLAYDPTEGQSRTCVKLLARWYHRYCYPQRTTIWAWEFEEIHRPNQIRAVIYPVARRSDSPSARQ